MQMMLLDSGNPELDGVPRARVQHHVSRFFSEESQGEAQEQHQCDVLWGGNVHPREKAPSGLGPGVCSDTECLVGLRPVGPH